MMWRPRQMYSGTSQGLQVMIRAPQIRRDTWFVCIVLPSFLGHAVLLTMIPYICPLQLWGNNFEKGGYFHDFFLPIFYYLIYLSIYLSIYIFIKGLMESRLALNLLYRPSDPFECWDYSCAPTCPVSTSDPHSQCWGQNPWPREFWSILS